MGRVYQSRTLRSVLQDHDAQLRKVGSASVLARSGLSVPGEGVTAVDGDLQAESFAAGSAGWRLQAGGNAEFNDLTLRGGIIGNDALTSPVVPAQAFQGAAGFGLTVAGSNVITINRTVPAGFTSVIVNAFGRIAAINSTASADSLYSAVDVNGTGGNQFGVPVAAGDYNTTTAGYSTLLTGLSAGDTVSTHLYGSTLVAAWATNAGNGADLSVTFLWFR